MVVPILKGTVLQLSTVILMFYIFTSLFTKRYSQFKKITISIVIGTVLTGLEYYFNLTNYEELMMLLCMIAVFCVYIKFNFKQPLTSYLQALLCGITSYLVSKISIILTELIIIRVNNFSGIGETPNHEFTWGTTILCIVLFYLISGLIIYIISKSIKRVVFMYGYSKRIYYFFTSLAVIVAISIYSISEVFRVSNISMRYIWTVLVIILIVLIVFLFAVWMFANATIKEQKFKSEQENIRNLELYMGTLENNYNEVRKFRHDIKNALSALTYRINEYGDTELIEDVQSLLKEYNFNVMSDQRIDGLHYINNPFIKGLIFSKYLEAQTKGVHFNIEVRSNVLESSEKYSDEFRILGILLDNAIEAAVDANTPEVTISIEDNDSYHSFLIVNTIDESASINLSDISKEGYSSKGTDRGLGLATVKEITDSSDSILINFKIEKGKFIVSLSVDEEI